MEVEEQSHNSQLGAKPVDAEPLTRRDPEETDPRCDLCGAPMLERHCKLVCVQCGYQRDCSDP